MKRKPKRKLSPLYKMLQRHLPMCTYYIYSGDRHCSCGRDKAIETLRKVRELLGEDVAVKVLGASG
jgi:hypothetical protein